MSSHGLLLCLLTTILHTCLADRVTDNGLKRLLENYDASYPPNAASGRPTVVRIGIYISDMDIQPKDETIHMDLIVRNQWIDSKLGEYYEQRTRRKLPSSIEKAAYHLIWRPDIFFRQAKMVEKLSLAQPNMLLRVDNSSGGMWLAESVRVVLNCPGLSAQFSEIQCDIKLEYYASTSEWATLRWLDSPVDIDPNVQMQGYTLRDTVLHDCSQNYTAGTFMCRQVSLMLQSDFVTSLYLSGIYLSSFLLVLVSWLGFWIDGQKILERLGLGLLVCAILAVHHIAAGQYSHQRANGHSVEGWITFCLALVIATLLEYGFAYVLLKMLPRKIKGEKIHEEDESGSVMEKVARVVDIACGLIVFPIIFVAYNSYYWSTYMP